MLISQFLPWCLSSCIITGCLSTAMPACLFGCLPLSCLSAIFPRSFGVDRITANYLWVCFKGVEREAGAPLHRSSEGQAAGHQQSLSSGNRWPLFVLRVWKGRLEHPYTAHLRDRQQVTNSSSAQETGDHYLHVLRVWKGRLEHPYTAHLRDRQQATNSPSAQETGDHYF